MLHLICGLTLVMAGCSHPRNDQPSGVKVVIESGREVPDFLVGRWIADQHGWEFVIEPDGRISSAVLSLGRVRVSPGKTTTVPTRTGNDAVFAPGLWVVHYAPDTRELTVKITMDHVRVEMADNILEGSSTDIFAGPVGPAGDTWQAQWTTFTHYTAHTLEGASFDLSTDPIYGEAKPLVFHKAADPPRIVDPDYD